MKTLPEVHTPRRLLGSLLSVGAIVAAVVAPAEPASAETIDRIVAVVDDNVLTMHDVRTEGRIRLAGSNVNIAMLDMAPNRREQLEMLVTRMVQTRLLAAEADTMQVPIGEEDVNARLKLIYDRFGKTEAEYRQLLESEGVSWEAFRAYLRNELKSQTVIQAELGGQVSVDEVDIETCARDKVPSGTEKPVYTVRQILVAADPQRTDLGGSTITDTLYPQWWDAIDRTRFAAANMLYVRTLESGETFESLARTFSSGRSRERGGKLGDFSPGDLSSEFAPVFDLRVGDISDIIETSAGFHIMTVDAIQTAANEKWPEALKACRAELQAVESQKVIDGFVETLAQKHFVDVKIFDDISDVAESGEP